MTDEDDFITQFMRFGLTEKEVRCYYYLLKYGPKTPSPLAKSLHTYRQDVHRTLTALIEKGMVQPTLDAPTVYTAVELKTALESALKKHEAELRELEMIKQELGALSRPRRFPSSDEVAKLAQQHKPRPPEEVSTFKIMKGLKELLATTASLILTLEEDFSVVVVSLFGINPLAKEFIERGGENPSIGHRFFILRDPSDSRAHRDRRRSPLSWRRDSNIRRI